MRVMAEARAYGVEMAGVWWCVESVFDEMGWALGMCWWDGVWACVCVWTWSMGWLMSMSAQ